jgi:small-conductance mechanosensitive channel
MPTENVNKADDLIDVGEADQQATEINLDTKGEPEKVEAPKEEKIEVEQVSEEAVEEKKVEPETKKDDELKEYSEGVQKRIAKLTRKMREAERQKEEAVAFADAVNRQKSELEGRLSKLDKSYTSEFENRVTNSMVAAKQALKSRSHGRSLGI